MLKLQSTFVDKAVGEKWVQFRPVNILPDIYKVSGIGMDFMFDWDNEGDRFSFEDSDRFEEDSLCSWISEPESLCNNWRGWKRQNGGQATNTAIVKSQGELTGYGLLSLIPI